MPAEYMHVHRLQCIICQAQYCMRVLKSRRMARRARRALVESWRELLDATRASTCALERGAQASTGSA